MIHRYGILLYTDDNHFFAVYFNESVNTKILCFFLRLYIKQRYEIKTFSVNSKIKTVYPTLIVSAKNWYLYI